MMTTESPMLVTALCCCSPGARSLASGLYNISLTQPDMHAGSLEDAALTKSISSPNRLLGDDGDIDPELFPGREPDAPRADGERMLPVLGLSSPPREPLRPPPPAELPPVTLSTTHRASPEAAAVLPDKGEPRQPPSARPELLRETSGGRWHDGPEWRQPPADTGGHDRPNRNGFDRAADWDRRGGDRSFGGRGDHGRYGQHGGRSALAGPPYNDLRMELVDPTLFPPLPPGRSPRHGDPHQQQQLSHDPSADRAPAEAEPPADDRNEFEKELEAVVAELQRVRICSRSVVKHSKLTNAALQLALCAPDA